MIKQNNEKSRSARPLFHPSFGSRPQEIIGRDAIIQDFLDGLESPIGSQQRSVFFSGQRGMGKTALLLELADRAKELDYVVVRVTAYEGMPDDIIETLQRNGAPYVEDGKRHITGVEAGALGFSFGLTFTEETQRQYGFRTKLTLLVDELEKHGKGVLILIDEACTSEEMRQVAVTYQHLVGEEKNIAIAMAGLPSAISGVLNDKVLTFLNRAKKVHLEPISNAEVSAYFTRALKELGIKASRDVVSQMVEAASGFPYLVQLVGYYAALYGQQAGEITQQGLDDAISDAFRDLEDNVFKPMLAPLSENDMALLMAMADDDGVSKTSDLKKRLNVTNSHIQPYRARLIEAGVIESPRKGELEFSLPHLARHLRSQE